MPYLEASPAEAPDTIRLRLFTRLISEHYRDSRLSIEYYAEQALRLAWQRLRRHRRATATCCHEPRDRQMPLLLH